MLKLKNVSKFYYSNGVISSGFTKVNLDLFLGEFVAITGESGSGKSTLLNVISGLDTYEEGEMYVNGQETSAYTALDFENYRRKYIANIYQSFNLINSYTVAQNVEMVLLLSGLSKKERKAKVEDILQKVDLYQYRNTKASRLSGGQKQRVAIARALVKDTPIIVADEPTGNLDTASAAGVIELLSSLAKDRLVVVVTHNYEQVENYVSRKITMHDGRITEDIKLKDVEIEEYEPVESEVVSKKDDDEKPEKHHLKFGGRLLLGFRNAFNIVPKFLLLLFIFIFVAASVTSLYSNLRESDFNKSLSGYNYYFNNTDNSRIVIKKADGTAFTEEDYQAIAALPNIKTIVKEDIILDSSTYLETTSDGKDSYYLNGNLASLSNRTFTSEELFYGRLPESENEVIFDVNISNYYATKDEAIRICSQVFALYCDNGTVAENIKVVGVAVHDDDNWERYFYCNDSLIQEAAKIMVSSYSNLYTKIGNETIRYEKWGYQTGKVVASDKVARGEAMVALDYKEQFDGTKFVDTSTATINLESIFFKKSKDFKITTFYSRGDFTKKTGVEDVDWNYGIIFINPDDYSEFFKVDNYQSSVFVADLLLIPGTELALKEMGYSPLVIKDSLMSYSGNYAVVEEIFQNIWSGTLLVVLFFVSYFIIKLIMKSRNVYFATARMLGATASDCKSLIRIDLMVVLNLAFLVIVAGIVAAARGAFVSDITTTILTYFTFTDYAILYLGLNLIAFLIAGRYSRQLFKSSALNVYKEA